MMILQCPECNQKLKTKRENLVCQCGATYPVVGSIPVLVKSSNYYGEVSKERKAELLKAMDKGLYWRDLVWEYFGTSYPYLHHIIVDETRNDFRYFLPLNKNSIVLDLGAGWGTMSCHFARSCQEVVALDGILDRCEFIQKRCVQDSIKNVTPVCSNIFKHPFPKNSFDVVVMNGVLEWIGTPVNGSEPQELQLKALKIIREILKPDGVLYIGIENSYGFKYITGEMDDHTGLHHISYLRRDKANEKALKESKRSYRTYTYDWRGYELLLKQAGFDDMSFYYPLPDYKSVKFLLNLDSPDLLTYFHNNLNETQQANSLVERIRSLELHAIECGHVADYAAGYSIVACNSHKKSLKVSITDYMQENWQIFSQRRPSYMESLQISGREGKYFEKGRLIHVIFANGEKEPSHCAVFCRSKDYESSLQKEYDIYTNSILKGNLAFEIPEGTCLTEINNYKILFRKMWKGESITFSLANICCSPDMLESVLLDIVNTDFNVALECLMSLHKSTERKSSDVSFTIDSVSLNTMQIYGNKMGSKAESLRAVITALYRDKPNCLIHGDFTPSNVLRLKEDDCTHKVGVIDWELSTITSLTILDYGRFCYYYIIELCNCNIFNESVEVILNRIFVKRDHMLSPVIWKFLEQGLADIIHNQRDINSLMQFMLFHDAVLQNKHSVRPSHVVGESYLKIIDALEVKE